MFALRRFAARSAQRWAPSAAPAWSAAPFSVKSASDLGLGSLGIVTDTPVQHNMSYDEIHEAEKKYNEGVVTALKDTVAINTAPFYGRSPKDRYVVENEPSKNHVDWGDINVPMAPEVFDELYDKCIEHYNKGGTTGRIHVFDGFCGTHKGSRMRVRFITEYAWQHHFVTNMFIRPTEEELVGFEPDFTIVNACTLTNPDFKRHGLRSEVFVGFNIEKGLGIIGGTHYGGEMKKGIFAMMNYRLPLNGHMPMHCSANKGKDGDTALFFGLSGTGKTTLSADPHRFLIGDDEHGWDDEGIFNFEGGCYAKTIGLDAEKEPDIYNAIRRDALLENVVLKGLPLEIPAPDFDDASRTENGRVSYPIFHIDNYDKTSSGTHPANIIFLTCDAYGVLPPVSKLTPEQASYHFLSGYTAKIPGTELGVQEPTPTFSACFGAVFMPHHPFVYAKLLAALMRKHGSNAYLVNTGWSGGAFPKGGRLDIPVTRACIDAILDGSINDSEFVTHPVFNVSVPQTLGEVDPNVLNPRDTWADKADYDAHAAKLAQMFADNFAAFSGEDSAEIAKHGPIVA